MPQKFIRNVIIAFLAINLGGWVAFLLIHGRGERTAVAPVRPAPLPPAPAATPATGRVARVAMPPPADIEEPPRQHPVANVSGPALRLSGFRTFSPSTGRPSVRLGFSEYVKPDSAKPAISCTPPVAFSVDTRWFSDWDEGNIPGANPENLVLTGDFVPGKRYRLHISGDLRAQNGARMNGAGKTVDVYIPDREPSVRFLSTGGRYLVPNGPTILPFQVMNVTNLHLSAERILPRNLMQLVMRENGGYARWYGTEEKENVEKLVRPAGERDYPVKPRPNEPVTIACDLAAIVGEGGSGAYFVKASVPGRKGDVSKVVCVTDLGIGAKLGRGTARVLVTSLATARPRAGVEVTVYSDCNETVGTGTTGPDGQAAVALEPGARPAAVVVRDPGDGDISFLPLVDRTALYVADDGAPYVEPGGCEAFLYTERGVYRPGETVFCEAILRGRDMVAPRPFPVAFKLFGIRGDLLRTVPAMADADGSVRTTLELPEAYQLGRYRLLLSTPGKDGKVLGETAFEVETIVPPQIRVEIGDLPARIDGAGNGAVGLSVSSSYLFGAAAAGLKATAQLQFLPVAFTSPAWANYRFGDLAAKKEVLPPLRSGPVRLDGDGRTSFTFLLKSLEKVGTPIKASFKVLVLEPGGRARPAVATTMIDTRPWYIGLCAKEVVRPDSQVAVDWALVRPDGTLADPKAPLRASLVVEESNWACHVDAKGRSVWAFETTDVPVFSDRAVPSDGSGKGRFTFPAPEASWNDYRLVFSDETGNRSSVRFSVSEWREDGGRGDPAAFSRLELKPDRESYQPGETASVHLAAPFTGTLWITVEGDGLLQSLVVPLERKETEISLPVTEGLAPDVKVTATVLRPVAPEEMWAPHRASGSVSLSVRPAGHLLDVAIDAPPEMAPAGRLPVTVCVTNRASGPVADGAVTVMVVDEALCILTDLSVPSPVDHFFRHRLGAISQYDLFSELMQVTDESLLGFRSHAGGDEAAPWRVRLNPIKVRRFKPLSMVKAKVPVRDGKAAVSFDLPEFTGRVRVMAVAHTKDATGSAEAATFVRRKVVVQPDMARCLAPGDRSELTVSFFNRTDAKAPVSLSVRCEGPVEAGPVPPPFVLSPQGSRSLAVPVRATDGIGPAKVVVDAVAGDESFSQTIDLPVRPAASWETTASAVTVGPGRSVRLEPVEDVLPGTLRQRLEFSVFPVADVRSAIDFLVAYPFDCLEQTVSRAYPFLRLAALPEGVVAEGAEYDPATRVRAAIASLALMRRGTEGFAMWSDCLPVHGATSLYAIQFLAEAIREGYETGEMTRGLLGEMVSRIEGWHRFDETEVALCYALLGRPDRALMARLAAQADLTTEQLARLARASLLAGDPGQARGLLERAGSPTTLISAVLLLEAWTALDPTSPRCALALEKIAGEKDRRRGHWGTTWRNANVARATLASLAATGDLAGDACVHLKLQIEEDGKSDTIVFPGKRNRFSITEKRNGAILVVNTGTNTLWARRSLRAVPRAADRPAARSRLGVFRNYYTPDGHEVDLANLRKGDAVVVELIVVPTEETGDLIVEDLLPACLEVESVDLAALGTFPWIRYDGPAVLHAEARDDRVLVFPDIVGRDRPCKWYYLARVVSAGDYVAPAVRAEAMYKPEVFARGEERRVSVRRE